MGQLVFQATLGGQVNLVGPNTASTYNINVPAVAGTMVTTGDTGSVSSTMLASSLSLTTPNIGTPSAGTLTNCTGLPAATGLTGVVAQNNGGTGTTTGYYGFKNRIINGAMAIDQRNAGASVTPTDGQYTLDRWQANQAVASKYSVQQNAGSVTPPAGFTKYLGVTSLSAYTVGASEYFCLRQNIEGFNTADLAWGTASASPVTLSFWVRSSLTGTFGATLMNENSNRSYPFTYTINSANTWEYKTITVNGDTSGTWATTNGVGLRLTMGMGVGSTYSGAAGAWASANYLSATGATSVVGTSGATFYITGVQLEKGTVATSFDYRPYGTELQLCQRYYQTIGEVFGNGAAANSGNSGCFWAFGVQMRATPTITYTAEFGTVSATYPDPTKCTFSGTSSASNQFAVLYAKAAAEL